MSPRTFAAAALTVAACAGACPARAQDVATFEGFVTDLQRAIAAKNKTIPPLPPVTPRDRAQIIPPSDAAKPIDRAGNLDAPDLVPVTPPPADTEVPADEKNILFIDAADDIRPGYKGDTNVTALIGNVKLRYNGYTITSDRAQFDKKRRFATIEGGATIDTGRELLFYDFLRVNLDTAEFFGRQGRTVVPVSELRGQVLEPLRISGAKIERLGKITIADNGFLTTCDYDLPHYRIGFRKASVIPNDRIALRDVKVYFGERVVARLKYLSVPIRDAPPRYSYLPVVGRTQEEGYFIKNAIGYNFGAKYPGYARVDRMEKKGTGLGFDQAYTFGKNAAGALFLYTLDDASRNVRNLSGRLSHSQRVETAIVNVSSDFQNNSYNSLSANSKTGTTTINATRPTPIGNTGVQLSFNNSDYGTSASKNNSYTLTQEARVGTPGGNNATISLRINGTRNVSNSTFAGAFSESGRVDQNADIRASGRISVFDFEALANKNLVSRAIGAASGGFFSGTQRLPDIQVRLNSQNLSGFLKKIPSVFSVGYAQFLEGSTRSEAMADGTTRVVPISIATDRLLFNADVNPETFRLTRGGGLTLRSTGNFRQSVYRGGDTMQYLLQSANTLTQRLGRNTTFAFDYRYLRPYGGTPLDFRQDQTGAYNNAGLNFNLNESRVRITANTNYDFQRARDRQFSGFPRNPWQNLSLGIGLRPVDFLETRFAFTYDINTSRLVAAQNRLRVRLPYGFALDTGATFDPKTHKFPQATALLQTPLPFGFRISAQAQYNGIQNRFDYKNIGITRSYHDYEVSVRFVDQPYGFRTEKGINFGFRLKAFPDVASPQGLGGGGQFGTALDTGTGSVF